MYDDFLFFLVCYGLFNVFLIVVWGLETWLEEITKAGSLKRWD